VSGPAILGGLGLCLLAQLLRRPGIFLAGCGLAYAGAMLLRQGL
jgi:hypothetical protein